MSVDLPWAYERGQEFIKYASRFAEKDCYWWLMILRVKGKSSECVVSCPILFSWLVSQEGDVIGHLSVEPLLEYYTQQNTPGDLVT